MSVVGKVALAAVGVTAIAGGTALVVVDQNAANRETENKAGIERTIGDLRSDLLRERGAREKDSATQARLLEQTQRTADEALLANGELSGRLSLSERENFELKQTNEEQSRIIEERLFAADKIIARSGSSAVNINSGPDDKYAWSGTIIKDNNGTRYLLTCGHAWSDLAELYGVGDPNEGKFKVTGYKGLFEFKMKPEPLPNGVMAYSQSGKGDIAVFPISKEIDEMFNRLEREKGVTIGIRLGNIADDFSPFQRLFGVGNPRGRKDSHYRGEIINTSQGLAGAIRQPRLDYGFIPGNSGMGLVDRNANLTGMAISVTPDYVATANFHGLKHLKIWLERFGIPVTSESERQQIEYERALSSIMLPTPNNPFAQFASSLASQTEDPLINDSVARPLLRFGVLPTPIAPLPLGNLILREK